MPVFYNYTENGVVYSFDDVFVPADAFRQGNLWGWGLDIYGQLGTDTDGTRSIPATTSSGGANWKQVSGGGYHTAAIKTDGTLWSLGSNNEGQLGDNTVTTRFTPVTTFTGGTNWKQVSCGWYHRAAIKTDGTLWVWGRNTEGQLGDNTVTNRSTPVTTFVGGTNWKQVAGGFNYTAAIKTDGTLWVWGRNNEGQLGTNNLTNRSTPVTTFTGGTNWKQVSCGTYHTAAIKTDGTLWTWGNNSTGGQLGDNTATNRSTPVQVFGSANNWKQVSGGRSSTAAIKTDGTLWTWGTNALGANNTTVSVTPITTFAGGTNWKQVSCGGYSFTAAIKTDGTLWTWGSDYQAMLGTNTYRVNKLTPVTTFVGGTNWKQVGAGDQHCVAVTYIDDYI